MAKIKKIQVKVTYSVGYCFLTAPKKVLKQLNKIADKGDDVDFSSTDYPEACDWILNTIRERDCYESSFQIEDLE